jgi:hypothetical protein
MPRNERGAAEGWLMTAQSTHAALSIDRDWQKSTRNCRKITIEFSMDRGF